MNEIQIKKRIHRGYTEYETAKSAMESIGIPQIFGKYQYIYSSPKGKISLAEFVNDMYGEYRFEIYSIEGKLFEYVERFESKELAEQRIKELLCPPATTSNN